MIKTFRGSIADDGMETIRLHTIDGSTGYRIKKLEVMASSPGTDHTEIVLKVFKTPQTTPTVTVDFSDQTLLAAAYYEDSATAGSAGKTTIIFDSEVFNQDIYVTYKDNSNATSCNYYMELETIPLSAMAAEYTTIKDLRSNTATVPA
jgi:hypothetical protein